VPSPRQILYALVAAGLHIVVAVLVLAGSATGAVPGWATALLAVLWLTAAAIMAKDWQRTGRVLGLSLGVFIAWAVLSLVSR